MRLKAVYFLGRSATGLPYHKAMVYEDDVPYFLKMGAILDQPLVAEEDDKPKPVPIPTPSPVPPQEPEEVIEPINPDEGYGRPGSYRWHVLHINGLKEKNEIVDYTSVVIRKDAGDLIDRRRTINVIKREAKKLIKEHLKNDNQS